jgi:hypothetical protein
MSCALAGIDRRELWDRLVVALNPKPPGSELPETGPS